MALLGVLRALRIVRGALLYAVWASVAFSLPVLESLQPDLPELPAATLVLIALWIALSGRLTPIRALVASAVASLLPWLHVRYLILAVALVVGIAITSGLREGSFTGQERSRAWRTCGVAVAPLAVSLLAMSLAFWNWSGYPLAQRPVPPSGHQGLRASRRAVPLPVRGREHAWLGIRLASDRAPARPGRCGTRTARVAISLVGRRPARSSSPPTCCRCRRAAPDRLRRAVPDPGDPARRYPARPGGEIRSSRAVRLLPLAILTWAFAVNGVRHAKLLYAPVPGDILHVPLAVKLHTLWPNVPAAPGDRYPYAVFVAGWIAAIAFVGWLFLEARRPRSLTGA